MGMNQLLVILSTGKNIHDIFPDVVKNVVYQADVNETCREIALLSINSFQTNKPGGLLLFGQLLLCQCHLTLTTHPTHLDTTDTTHCSTTSC